MHPGACQAQCLSGVQWLRYPPSPVGALWSAPDVEHAAELYCAHRGDCADAAGPARNARAAAVGTEIVFQGAMVSIIMFTPANALSISPRTRSTSPFRNA